MKILKVLLIITLIAVSALYGYTTVSQQMGGTDIGPTMQCDTETLDISVTEDESALLRGVTASDEQDGDLTGHIMISGISKMVGDHNAQITYVVFDSDHNSATLTRTLHYTDYVSPRFEILEPLIYGGNESIALLDRLLVDDCIDGNITSTVRISYLNQTDDPSVYSIDLQATNSMGDTARITLPVILLENRYNIPEIHLKSYLVYLSQGETFTPRSYLSYVETLDGAGNLSDVTISGTVDSATPGTYFVSYTYPYEETTARAVLTVVVE